MEIRKDVQIIEKGTGVDTVKFKLRDADKVDYIVNNCSKVLTEPNRICYSGNITLKADSIFVEKDVCFWDNLNNTGVLVYQE